MLFADHPYPFPERRLALNVPPSVSETVRSKLRQATLLLDETFDGQVGNLDFEEKITRRSNQDSSTRGPDEVQLRPAQELQCAG
jgi:hypothetical protein